MPEFEGAVPALVTPMTPDDAFNEEAFRKLVEYNINAGAHGFWMAGGSGESIMLDDDENGRIAEASVDQSAGRARIIMHVGAPTTARAARMAERAARAGVDAICCVPPFFYRISDDDIAEHYRTVAAAADLPLFIYNLPSCTGVEITPQLAARVQDRVPQLLGLKHSAPFIGHVRSFAKMGLRCFIGNSTLMLPALTMGAIGCVDGPPSLAPEVWVEIYEAYKAGDLPRSEQAQSRAAEIAGLFQWGNYHATIKALLSHRLGIDLGTPRAPQRGLSKENHTMVIKEAEAIGLGRLAG